MSEDSPYSCVIGVLADAIGSCQNKTQAETVVDINDRIVDEFVRLGFIDAETYDHAQEKLAAVHHLLRQMQ